MGEKRRESVKKKRERRVNDRVNVKGNEERKEIVGGRERERKGMEE